MTVTSQPRDGARLASKEERAARAKKGKKDDRPEQFYITHGLRNEPPGSERLTPNGLFEEKDPFFSQQGDQHDKCRRFFYSDPDLV